MTDELANKTILIVDDDQDIMSAMLAALEDLGPTLLTANNGDDAITEAQKSNPDVVVLDMMLPKRSGFLVMEKLKRGKKPSDPPRIIMVTGNEGTRHKVYAESLGVSKYLNKPFRMEVLVEAVKKLLD